MMIRGFDKAVATMNVGDVIDIHLEPSEAYGELDPAAGPASYFSFNNPNGMCPTCAGIGKVMEFDVKSMIEQGDTITAKYLK